MKEKTIGDRLREARVAKQLSLYDVEALSKIEVQYLLALEMDQVKILPKELREKAVKDYAKVVGLDGSILLKEHSEREELIKKQRAEDREREEQKAKEDNRPLSRFSNHKREEKRRSAYLPLMALSLIAILIVLFVGYVIFDRFSASISSKTSQSYSLIAHNSETEKISPSTSSTTQKDKKSSISTIVDGNAMTVDLSNAEDEVTINVGLTDVNSSWVSVTNSDLSSGQLLSEDGTKSYTATLNKDATSSLISLEQTKGVSLSIDGENIDLSDLNAEELCYITLNIQ
ncbi:helix-turn-helix domain-containing protein [Streptococcus dentiloxodontae]